MGATLSCDCCKKDIPQGDGPNRTVPVWEDPDSKDMMHLCVDCYNPVFLVALCKNPLAYTQRTAWDVLGQENAKQLNAANTGPVREAVVGVRRVIDQTFWRHCNKCGAESASGRNVDDDLCFFCREPLEPLEPTAPAEAPAPAKVPRRSSPSSPAAHHLTYRCDEDEPLDQ